MRFVCTKCREEKELEDFYPEKRIPKGHTSRCRSCIKKEVAEDKRLRKQRLGLTPGKRGRPRIYPVGEKRKYYPKTITYMHKYRFGGLRELVIARDGEKCIACGITRIEHKEFYKMDITVDHIDGNGRHSMTPNNDMSNLQTLCIKCHGRKDGLRNGKRKEVTLEK